jgi:DNA-binding MarR family transcriptional regulator
MARARSTHAPVRPDQHDPSLSTAAWQALRHAHEEVAGRLATELDRCCDLAVSEFDVLFSLYAKRDEDVRLQDLVEAVSLSQPALSRLVARLEGRGLVGRSGAVDDRRVWLLRLTPGGLKLAQRAISVHAETVDAVLSRHLTDRQQRDLVAILGRATTRRPGD